MSFRHVYFGSTPFPKLIPRKFKLLFASSFLLGCGLVWHKKIKHIDPNSYLSPPLFADIPETEPNKTGQFLKVTKPVEPQHSILLGNIKYYLVSTIQYLVNSLYPETAIARVKEFLQEQKAIHITPLLEDIDYSFEALNQTLPGEFQILTYPQKLLPPPLPPDYQPITVCLELELLYDPAARMLRGGAEFLLQQLPKFCEVVILSNHQSELTMEAVRKIDRAGKIPFTIGHEAFGVGTELTVPFPRDLDRLDRDLSKVVCIDKQKQQYPKHPENVLLLPSRSWAANPYDRDLYDMLIFIKYLAKKSANGKDLREIIPHYDDVDPAKVARVWLGEKPNNKLHPKNLRHTKVRML